MIGRDQAGKRVFDVWLIKQVDDQNTIHTDRIETKTFEIPLPAGVSSVSLEGTLSYLIAPEAQPIVMFKNTKVLSIKD